MAGSCRPASAEKGSDDRDKGSSCKRFLELERHVGGSASVEINAAPDLEVHQGKKLIGAVDAIRLVISDETGYLLVVEEASLPYRSLVEHAVEHGLQAVFQPRAHGRAKSTLLAFEYVRREHIGQRELHRVLQTTIADLDFLWNRRCELDKLVIEERNTAFQRCRHAHL